MTRREIIKCICFILIVAFLIRSITYVTRTNGEVKDRFTGFYWEPNDTIDVIYFGSSPVYPCFATPQIYGEQGIVSYALSTHMQRPTATRFLIEEALKTQSPGLLVFEVRMFASEEDAMMSNMAHTRGVTDNMKYSLNRIRAINALVPADAEEARYTYYFDIFKYHSNWKTMALKEQWYAIDYEHPDDLKGFVPIDEVGPSEPYEVMDQEVTEPLEDIQQEQLILLCEYLKEHDLQALFTVVPTKLDEKSAGRYRTIENTVSQYGYPFLNMNEYYREIGIDFETDFQDYGNHVNAKGAEKVSGFFGRYLRDHYDLADRRGDDRYQSWEKAYDLWKTETADAKDMIAMRLEQKDYYVTGVEE